MSSSFLHFLYFQSARGGVEGVVDSSLVRGRFPFLLTLLLVLLFSPLNGCSSSAPIARCVDSSDCEAGNICLNAYCIADTGYDCPAGRTYCSGDSECESGACYSGCCSPRCASRLDCEDGEFCREGVCQPQSPGYCVDDRQCVGKLGLPRCHPLWEECVACLADSDCGAGRACDSEYQCVEDLGLCLVDEDCPSTEAPRCLAKEQRCVFCLDNFDCELHERCDESVCVEAPMGCDADQDCAEVPGRGFCEPQQKLCGACVADEHCGQGQRCNLHTLECDSLPGCGSHAECAGDLEGEWCRMSDRRCVSCLESGHCAEGQVCLSDQSCASDGKCRGDVDCKGGREGEKAFCRERDGSCVECREHGHCGEGAKCNEGRCVAESGCSDDSECGSEAPFCRVELGVCVECRQPSHCDVFERCVANECVPGGCLDHLQCAQEYPGSSGEPAKPWCIESECVQCYSASHCPSTQVCWEGRCAPATCGDDSDCAQFESRTHCSGLCVECVHSNDCAEGWSCRDLRCVAPCEGHGDCAGGQPWCFDGECVRCLESPHCPRGSVCEGQRCVETGIALPCIQGYWCAQGQLCVDSPQGGPPICEQSCDPYAVDSGCSANFRCELLSFDGSGKPLGACLEGAGEKVEGDLCQPGDSCGPGLQCVAESLSHSYCRRYCNPEVSSESCPSPKVCEPVAQLDENRIPRSIGLCMAESGKSPRCSTSGDCLSGQVCVAAPRGDSPLLPANSCRWPVGSKADGAACQDHLECRSGRCVSGAPRSLGSVKYCQAACSADSHCPGSSRCIEQSFEWFEASGWPENFNLPACVPECLGDFDCGANETCVPVANQEKSHWAKRCIPRQPGSSQRSGGACMTNAQCWSGICLTSSQSPTDGICFGACDPVRNGADCGLGTTCFAGGVPFVLDPGPDGQTGTEDDIVEPASVCWGVPCKENRECSGFSNDLYRQRMCSPEPAPGKPDDIILRCMPRLGNGGLGSYCEQNSDCGTGYCVTWANPDAPNDPDQFKKRCFATCRPAGGIAQPEECLNDTVCTKVRWTETSPETMNLCVPTY